MSRLRRTARALRGARGRLHMILQGEQAERLGTCLGRLFSHVDRDTVAEFVEAEAFVVIGGLVVEESCRRSGIGRMLMKQAEDWARAQGCAIVRLWLTRLVPRVDDQ